jgi:uncharacterized protein YjbI with pentapeptide repeats
LNGAHAHQTNLEKAILSDTSLNGTDLYKARLVECNMRNTAISNASLTAADFTKADLTDGGIHCMLWETIFKHANLLRLDFTHSWLSWVDFDGANRDHIKMDHIDLSLEFTQEPLVSLSWVNSKLKILPSHAQN